MDETESGVREAAKFALPAGCGGPEGKSALTEGLRSGRDESIKEVLAELPHLNAFLGAISDATGCESLSLEVVMSYWLGGGLPETEEPVETCLLTKHYTETISPEFAQKIKDRLPKKIYLTHLTMVALIASADLSGDARLVGINHCMVSSGYVTNMSADKKISTVKRDVLIYREGGGFEVTQKTVDNVVVDPDLTPNLKAGDLVAMHQGAVADVLTLEDFDRLIYWNKKVAQTLT